MQIKQVVVHFWAPWCEPCSLLDTVLAQLCSDTPSIKGARVEAEEQPDIAEKYNISAVPLFLFFSNGKEVERLEGADPAALTATFSKLTSSSSSKASLGNTTESAQQNNTNKLASAPTAVETQTTEALQQQLQELINQQPVMLFMKGNPDAPRCGFSSKVANALKSNGIEFGHFDILSNEAVRQGLKEYSKWPTYPQVYAKGELVGGCDIILELAETGELKVCLLCFVKKRWMYIYVLMS